MKIGNITDCTFAAVVIKGDAKDKSTYSHDRQELCVYNRYNDIVVKELYNGKSLTYNTALIYVVSEIKIKYSDTV